MAKIKKVVVAEAAATEPTKAKKPATDKGASKFTSVGVFDGRRMRVAEYQDYTFSINDTKNRRLTDEQLAADWRGQFPNAVAFTPFHVMGARRDYNKGIHSKAFAGVKNPASMPWHVDAKGAKTQTPPAAVKEVKATTAPAPATPKAADKGKKKAVAA